MRLLTSLTALLFALTLTVPGRAKDSLDSTTVDPAHHKVVFENDQVRVVHWVIPVGDKTLMHSHPDSLIIALTDYDGRAITPEGKTSEVHAKAGSVTWRPALTHAVENIGAQPMEGLIVEPKNPSAAGRAGGN